ncbi:hypothetical protein [Corallococcus aberystwythensis]|uniref:Lipoprotein n=1 Tax=Corallococcus aberystwythensis TaxID=2316722 RepID=A0A3A8QWQ7_9BACT|nr:hypothetical protein [Corallococcus aberystwythensis]RKH67554.1 hypothetical protein D7W81_13620 [Corallococcus aberystwythensis]
MKMKTLLASLAFGSLLMACGGMETEAPMPETPSITTSEQPLCEGWDDGARRCSIKCTSTSTWLTLTDNVPKGGCQDRANHYCGRTAYGACWSF